MSSLAVRFSIRMHKQAVSAQGETTPGFGVPDGKCLKQTDLNEEIQKSPTVIISDSPKRASNALPALEGVTQDASKESYASLEDVAPTGGPPSIDNVVGDALSTETALVHRSRLDGPTSQLLALVG